MPIAEYTTLQLIQEIHSRGTWTIIVAIEPPDAEGRQLYTNLLWTGTRQNAGQMIAFFAQHIQEVLNDLEE